MLRIVAYGEQPPSSDSSAAAAGFIEVENGQWVNREAGISFDSRVPRDPGLYYMGQLIFFWCYQGLSNQVLYQATTTLRAEVQERVSRNFWEPSACGNAKSFGGSTSRGTVGLLSCLCPL